MSDKIASIESEQGELKGRIENVEKRIDNLELKQVRYSK